MSTGKDDNAETVVALVSGALIGAALTLLLVRMQSSRAIGSNANIEDYHYDGGDLFV